jgi:nicotinamide-nucleotide amidase
MQKSQNESLTVSLIVIGDEILYGRTADLNGTWMSKYLFKVGLNLKSIKFVRDNDQEIERALDSATLESDIIITSGGIGPTLDDKTKNILAKYFDKKIVEREDVAKIVTENYLRFGREWKQNLNFYHHFPTDFIPINNPTGLAPGIGYFDQNKGKLILSGPGVPREFQAMNEFEFYPLIKKYFGEKIKENFQVHIRTKSIPEEKIFNELCPNLWNELETFGKVSSLPHIIGIDIVVSFQADQAEFLLRKNKIVSIIENSQLKEYVWQYGNESINQMVLNLAKDKKLTFSFAESCTGGLTSSKITDLSGSSAVFLGSIISYDNLVKESQLQVPKEILEKFGAVSKECAEKMAMGARINLKTDIAISLTGIAGPSGGTKEKPVGLVYIGVSTPSKNYARSFNFPGDRTRLKDRFSEMALLMLLETLKEY